MSCLVSMADIKDNRVSELVFKKMVCMSNPIELKWQRNLKWTKLNGA